jgi:uncharacterized protein involved in exopolysaccharide biosynthesis
MELFFQIIKLIYRIRYWLLIGPLIVVLAVIYKTRNLPRVYEVSTTIYTGVASGFTIESGVETARIDWNSVNNGMDNLMSIIRSKTTLREVSIRLYAQNMIFGDSSKDNNYITAANFRRLVAITPKDVRRLIDKSSVDQTIENLNHYEKASKDNFVYGLFNWYHPHYSYTALSKIDVKRISSSDMLEIRYSSDDPGIAYNTLLLLNEEFKKQYETLRFGETNNVVEYFRQELAKLAVKLRGSEDSLTQYYIEKKVINYTEQTKQITALARDYDLLYHDALLRLQSSEAAVAELDKKIKSQTMLIENNTLFMSRLNKLSEISTDVTRIELLSQNSDSLSNENRVILNRYRDKLNSAESDLKNITNKINESRFSTEGIASTSFLEQWVDEVIRREKSRSEVKVMEDVRKSLDQQYVYFSPIGSTLKRKEREISFTEQSYLTMLKSLNDALMRQKTLQMSSATLKPINPPIFPISPLRTARRMIVVVAYFGSFLLILGYFLFLEVFDRTVRDKNRAERLIPAKVLGVYPRPNKIKYRRFNKDYEEIATRYLANSLVPFLQRSNRPNIINFISPDEHYGKSVLISKLSDIWSEMGINVRIATWHDNVFDPSKEYVYINSYSELFPYGDNDVILAEHIDIRKAAVPTGLLREATLNIFVVRADKVWRDIDKIAFERVKEQAGEAPIMLYLTNVRREVAETFLGMLPPYTFLRTFIYRIIQLGLTSK